MTLTRDMVSWRACARQFWTCTVIVLIGAIGAASVPASAQPARGELDATNQNDPRAARRVVLRFVTEGDFPPFNFYDEDGVLTGFNVDLARAVCVELNTACDINVREWTALLDTLAQGQADAAIAGHAVNPHALLKVDFSDRYFHTPGRFAGRRDAGSLDAGVDSLEGKRIGVASGTAHEAFVRQFFLGSRINVYDDAGSDALLENEESIEFHRKIGFVEVERQVVFKNKIKANKSASLVS